MNILEEIVAHKRKEVAERKELYPTRLLEQSVFFETPTVSFKSYLQRDDLTGIIAEIKRRSPSQGTLHPSVDVEQLSIGYMQAGASALSVLTDEAYFGGSNKDLEVARKFNFCPILRKDFIIDEYQIIEARSIGADVILLIARSLSPEEIARLATFAKSIGLEVLLEVHDEDELKRSLHEKVDVVGVNNRNLDDFSVSIERSHTLAPHIPDEFVKISESGLSSAESIHALKQSGFRGFLIGTSFMKTSQPHRTCARLIQDVKRLAEEA
ncbi:MAG TPA: indole-3-glycerol phosphate synthase TrpC [Myxococcales bacterium]|nr:indole-3-glycerol phosphate synthase [Deltaproteobacteria bacterium]MBU49090.1 indole-3-glycerol phosphate synthase [Deltaproteobacteria bacterium]HAA56810.1 indole-3-glycerol phosphate synthase TrpC [Myxococcales bacterium]|tara:strand:+ start:2497 stop:3300 length:804 start_codon:yes stop_codon:yes gene_type:complete